MEKENELTIIWQKLARGERDGFDALYNMYYNSIFAYCLGKIKNQESAENAVADVFIRIIRYKNLEDIESPENWMFTIARNICLNHLNKGNRRQKILNDISWQFDKSENSRTDQELDLEFIDRLIRNRLTDYDYEIWRLHQDGYDNKEIAERIGKTEKTIANRKVKIRNDVKEIVTPYIK